MDPERPVLGGAYDYPDGAVVPEHRHERAQLVYASRGVMTVAATGGLWVIPSFRAVWIPAGVKHAITMSGRVAMRTLYIDPEALPHAPRTCSVVQVSPLLRELIVAATTLTHDYRPDGSEARLMTVILDQIQSVAVAPLHLPEPEDSRLRVITEFLREHPDDQRTLDDWTRAAGASTRTLSRLFLRETGMSFRAWRQQLRLLISLRQLAAGESVTRVALDVGYNSLSAFIAMFHRALGEPPSRYFQSREEPPSDAA